MLFCPNCANVVTVLPSVSTGANKWTCPTCPFEFPMDRQVTSQTHLTRKEVDDVMGGEESWKNVDSTEGAYARADQPYAPSAITTARTLCSCRFALPTNQVRMR